MNDINTYPASYRRAKLRSIGPVDPASGEQGFSFDLDDGSVLRLCLDRGSAEWLLEGIARNCGDHLDERPSVATSQSSISSGNPHSDGSPQDGQNVAPVTRSSKADDGDA